MERFSFFGALVLLIIVQSPFIFSYSCDDMSGEIREACLEISGSDLSDPEKELLISNLEYENNLEPNHFLVYSKNTNIPIENAPDGVQIYNDRYIENAWMKIFTLMPSVVYQDSLYVPRNTKVLTGFHYEFDEPEDYRSSGYPRTSNGDCRTRYRLLEKTEENKIYVNGDYQGQGQLVPIAINQDSKIESVYTVKIKYDVNHYEWDRYCCKRRDGRCVRRCYDCDYDHDETKTGQIEIRDSIDVKIYKNNLVADILEMTNDGYSSRVKLNYSDSVEVSFVNSEYNYHKYLFEFVTSLPPYNVLTLKATNYGGETLFNLFRESDSLIINNIEECAIRGFDFFNEVESECSVSNSFVGLKIKTDKLRYDEGEEIEIEIFPKDVLVDLTYADKSYLVKNKITLNAVEPYNKIRAVYHWELSEKIIYIKNRSRITLLYNIFLVILVFIILYVIIKKYWRQIWETVAY